MHAPGALLYVGDGHAAQGDGDVLRHLARRRPAPALIKPGGASSAPGVPPPPPPPRGAPPRVGTCAPLARPRAESDDALISLACASSAVSGRSSRCTSMLDWLGWLRPRLAREDANMLLSVAADVRITQLVNGTSRGAPCSSSTLR